MSTVFKFKNSTDHNLLVFYLEKILMDIQDCVKKLLFERYKHNPHHWKFYMRYLPNRHWLSWAGWPACGWTKFDWASTASYKRMSSCRFIADWLFNVPRDYQLLDRLGSQIFHSLSIVLLAEHRWLASSHEYLAIILSFSTL